MCTIPVLKCANHAFVYNRIQLNSVLAVYVHLVEKVEDKFLKSLILLASSPDRPCTCKREERKQTFSNIIKQNQTSTIMKDNHTINNNKMFLPQRCRCCCSCCCGPLLGLGVGRTDYAYCLSADHEGLQQWTKSGCSAPGATERRCCPLRGTLANSHWCLRKIESSCFSLVRRNNVNVVLVGNCTRFL